MMVFGIRSDWCIALRMIANQEFHRKNQEFAESIGFDLIEPESAMTDDLEKYEALAKLLHSKRIAAMHYNQSGITSQVSVPDPDCATAADAITELVAMVRRAKEIIEQTSDARNVFRERAEAAERELAEFKRKMREPDDEMLLAGLHGYFGPAFQRDELTPAHLQAMRAAWLATVKYLLEEK